MDPVHVRKLHLRWRSFSAFSLDSTSDIFRGSVLTGSTFLPWQNPGIMSQMQVLQSPWPRLSRMFFTHSSTSSAEPVWIQVSTAPARKGCQGCQTKLKTHQGWIRCRLESCSWAEIEVETLVALKLDLRCWRGSGRCWWSTWSSLFSSCSSLFLTFVCWVRSHEAFRKL